MLENTPLGRAIRLAFVIAGNLLVLGIPAAAALSLTGSWGVAALDVALMVCRAGVWLAACATAAVGVVMCLPQRPSRR